MGQPRFIFESFDVKGVEISLKKIDYKELSKDLLPTYVPTLEGTDVELKREQTLAFKYYDQKGNDVTERKVEFEWWRVDPLDGQRTPASRKRSETISVVKKIPYSILEKNLIPKNFYLLYARRKKDDSPKTYALRVQQLREEAERYVAEGIAGIGSFSWGQVGGTPIPPNFCIVYPIIIDDKKFIWVMKLATAKLNPESEEFPYQDCVMTTDLPMDEKKRVEVKAETLAVESLITV